MQSNNMENSDDEFLSEVHIDFLSFPLSEEENLYVTRIPVVSETVESNIAHQETNKKSDVDDGDFEVARRKQNIDNNRDRLKNPNIVDHLSFVHHQTTILEDVGKQLWKGSLVLADFILSNDLFRESHCVELGCGIGLCSSLLISKAANVICTDKSDDILRICERNILENSGSLTLHNPNSNKDVVNEQCFKCCVLNWFDSNPLQLFDDQSLNNQTSKYSWNADSVSKLRKTNIIIAADCVYDECLTEALFSAILSLCSSSKEDEVKIFLSVEKRINFTLEDLDVSAPAYNHFLKLLQKMYDNSMQGDIDRTFKFQQLPLTFKKFICYERNKFLELWQITCARKNGSK